MPVERLDHFTIRSADLERTRAFYCDVLGLTAGPRPSVAIPGYWLYCGGLPQVHVAPAAAMGAEVRPGGSNGAFDHVAFRVSDGNAMIATLKARDIPYTERIFREFGLRQIVVHDPDGILVELNCDLQERP